MSKGVIFRFFECCPKSLMGALVFMLVGLTFLNNQLNFDIPSTSKIRDAAGFIATFKEVEPLSVHEFSSEIATSYTSNVPATYSASYSYTGANTYLANLFHINNPTPVSSPAVDAGYGVMRYTGYGGRFLYGHSTLGFARIKTLYVGDTFTVTMDGETATYQVSARYVFSKAAELDGSGNNARRTRIYSAIDESGARHSISLMTCGNGWNNDDGYRLVLYADRI